MTLAELIAAIRIEIQEATPSIWTDAEITRAVEKTISLMSRLIPRRDIVEDTLVRDIDDESFTTPEAQLSNAFVDAQTLNGKSDGDTLTIADKTPDVPRKLRIILTDANDSITALTLTIMGYDYLGRYVEESFKLPMAVRSGASRTWNGKIYFKFIETVEVTKISGTAAAADTVNVGTGDSYDSFIYLANKPIKVGSAVVTSSPAGTTYTLDTDYVMDYINGGIKFTDAGDMAAGTAYLISYELDPQAINLNAILPDYIKIESIEYPVGDTPPTHITGDVLGNILFFRGNITLTEDYHIRIIYLKRWSVPGTVGDADYPSHLDDVVIIGAVGQSLIFKAEEYMQTAITELALADTTLDGISAVTMTTAPDISAYLTAAETALTAAIARFAAGVTALGSMDTPLGDADTALDGVATQQAAAVTLLTTGEPLINDVPVGANVGNTYAAYAQVRAALAQSDVGEGAQRVAIAMGWEAKAARETTIGNSYLNEAVQRLAEAARNVERYQIQVASDGQKVEYYSQQISRATQYAAVATQYMNMAGRYLASGQAKINEFLVALGIKPEISYQKASFEQRV